MDPEKLNRRPWGARRGKKKLDMEGGSFKRLLKTENKLRVDGGVGERESG